MTDSMKSPQEQSLVLQAQVAREVWENYEDETRRRELSHWRGVGKYQDDNRWLSIGRKTVATLDGMSRFSGRPWHVNGAPFRVLEWGPGGGANAHALGRLADAYYGVDISASNLQEAGRMLEAEKVTSFRPIHLGDDIKLVRASIDQPIDLFLSTAVFQHFPSKEYGIAVLEEIRAVCRDNALGFIQIRYEDGRFKGATSMHDYKKHFVTATSYDIGEFAQACRQLGLHTLFMCDINEKVNYLTFCFRVLPRK